MPSEWKGDFKWKLPQFLLYVTSELFPEFTSHPHLLPPSLAPAFWTSGSWKQCLQDGPIMKVVLSGHLPWMETQGLFYWKLQSKDLGSAENPQKRKVIGIRMSYGKITNPQECHNSLCSSHSTPTHKHAHTHMYTKHTLQCTCPIPVSHSPLTSFWVSTPLMSCCSVAQLCPALCNPLDGSTPGFPVFHHLPEFAQTHVHWVSEGHHPLRGLALFHIFLLLSPCLYRATILLQCSLRLHGTSFCLWNTNSLNHTSFIIPI